MTMMRGGAHRPRALACGTVLLATLAAAAAARSAIGAGAAPFATADQPRPVREYIDASGRLCRVYLRSIVIDGKAETGYATVCRDADGRWVLSR